MQTAKHETSRRGESDARSGLRPDPTLLVRRSLLCCPWGGVDVDDGLKMVFEFEFLRRFFRSAAALDGKEATTPDAEREI